MCRWYEKLYIIVVKKIEKKINRNLGQKLNLGQKTNMLSETEFYTNSKNFVISTTKLRAKYCFRNLLSISLHFSNFSTKSFS